MRIYTRSDKAAAVVISVYQRESKKHEIQSEYHLHTLELYGKHENISLVMIYSTHEVKIKTFFVVAAVMSGNKAVNDDV